MLKNMPSPLDIIEKTNFLQLQSRVVQGGYWLLIIENDMPTFFRALFERHFDNDMTGVEIYFTHLSETDAVFVFPRARVTLEQMNQCLFESGCHEVPFKADADGTGNKSLPFNPHRPEGCLRSGQLLNLLFYLIFPPDNPLDTLLSILPPRIH